MDLHVSQLFWYIYNHSTFVGESIAPEMEGWRTGPLATVFPQPQLHRRHWQGWDLDMSIFIFLQIKRIPAVLVPCAPADITWA